LGGRGAFVPPGGTLGELNEGRGIKVPAWTTDGEEQVLRVGVFPRFFFCGREAWGGGGRPGVEDKVLS